MPEINVNRNSTAVRHDRCPRQDGVLRELLYRSLDACHKIRSWRCSGDDSVYADDWSSDYRWMLSERYMACSSDAASYDHARRQLTFFDVLENIANNAIVILWRIWLLAYTLFYALFVVSVRSCSLVYRRLSVYSDVVKSRPGQDDACIPYKQALVELVVQLTVIGLLNLFLWADGCWLVYKVIWPILGRILVWIIGQIFSVFVATVYSLFNLSTKD